MLTGTVALDSDAKAVTKLPLVYEAPPQAAKAKDAKDAPKAKGKGKGEKGDAAAAADAGATEGDGAEEVEAKKGARTDDDDGGDDEAAEDAKALDDALLAAKLARLTALREAGASPARYGALGGPLLAAHPEHLPLLLETLAYARRERKADGEGEGEGEGEGDVGGATTKEGEKEVGVAAARVVGAIDAAALAQHYGVAQVGSFPFSHLRPLSLPFSRRWALSLALSLSPTCALSPFIFLYVSPSVFLSRLLLLPPSFPREHSAASRRWTTPTPTRPTPTRRPTRRWARSAPRCAPPSSRAPPRWRRRCRRKWRTRRRLRQRTPSLRRRCAR